MSDKPEPVALTDCPQTMAMVRELFDDAASRKKSRGMPAQEPFDRALELCQRLESAYLREKDRADSLAERLSMEADAFYEQRARAEKAEAVPRSL